MKVLDDNACSFITKQVILDMHTDFLQSWQIKTTRKETNTRFIISALKLFERVKPPPKFTLGGAESDRKIVR